MKQDFPERKKLRLSGHNYSSAGAYFVTIRIKNPAIRLSEIKLPSSPYRMHLFRDVGGAVPYRRWNRLRKESPRQ